MPPMRLSLWHKLFFPVYRSQILYQTYYGYAMNSYSSNIIIERSLQLMTLSFRLIGSVPSSWSATYPKRITISESSITTVSIFPAFWMKNSIMSGFNVTTFRFYPSLQKWYSNNIDWKRIQSQFLIILCKLNKLVF